MLMTSDKEAYNHNRSIFNKDHEYMVNELQISPKTAETLKATYDHDLATFRLSPSYIAYFKLRKSGKTAKHAAIVLMLVNYEPARVANTYKIDIAVVK